MPELPEVETVVRGLQAVLPGRTIQSLQLGKTDFIDNPAALEQYLPGRTISSVLRHGKFLVLPLAAKPQTDLENGRNAENLFLLIHLGMTGQLIVCPPALPSSSHTHAHFYLDDGKELRYTDIRRFGRMVLVPESLREKILGPLGADPLQVSEAEFGRRVSARHARVKALLLDQRVFRGMGNIYTDESLWRARIHPARLGSTLKPEEIAALFRSVQKILREAIRLGGSSISDYVDSNGLPGEFQIRHRVYQREGKSCSRCGTFIRRITVAGRSGYFCPRCQRSPRLHGKAAANSHRERFTAKNKSAPRRPR